MNPEYFELDLLFYKHLHLDLATSTDAVYFNFWFYDLLEDNAGRFGLCTVSFDSLIFIEILALQKCYPGSPLLSSLCCLSQLHFSL